jgi:hypothetical protein
MQQLLRRKWKWKVGSEGAKAAKQLRVRAGTNDAPRDAAAEAYVGSLRISSGALVYNEDL